jgi:peptidoglycan/xylan/chitin deacetylase (PgdA/CDA1 family)
MLLLRQLFRSLLWRVDTTEKVLYLTFDDGPVPEVTPWVLDELQRHGAKATFFVVGNNVRKHPQLLQRLTADGHRVGNHTEHHVNGWNTPTRAYLREVQECDRRVRSRLFRPPYGRIRLTQIRALRKRFRIVMWDVLSRDYDRGITGDDCLQRVLRGVRPGSIVVFHDSLKAEERLRHALPRVLEHFSELGYRFEALTA